MDTNTRELTLEELEMAEGGWNLKKSLLGGVIGMVGGAAVAGAFGGVPGAVVGGIYGGVVGVISGGMGD